ncbi:transcriptional regulator [Paractinoplanes rishiriensis]|uniref:Transcriptional regulator n=1 Tax=Paractinoplanes rishiriensis TaxID=1050105 RepID=A0A919N185_9ACTN|nr:transcriptional regulator [Actinoplanes rishiriensis]
MPGQHRRYTRQDLDRLEVMLRLTAQGVAPAEAAAWARRIPAGVAASVGAAAANGETPPVPGAARDGGGQAIPLGPASPAARGLARAAMRLDVPAMRHLLTAALVEHGVIDTWAEVVVPVLIGIGERYQATERFVEVEHLLSRCLTEVLAAVPRPPGLPRVLLAAADEEQHTLPLEALAAALAEAGVPARLLGARVPPRALADAVTRTGPTAVVLWSQLPGTGDPTQLDALTAHPRPPFLVAAAGPGWPHELPAGVVQLTGLAEAVALVSAAVG